MISQNDWGGRRKMQIWLKKFGYAKNMQIRLMATGEYGSG